MVCKFWFTCGLISKMLVYACPGGLYHSFPPTLEPTRSSWAIYYEGRALLPTVDLFTGGMVDTNANRERSIFAGISKYFMEELVIQAMFDKVIFDKTLFVQNSCSRNMCLTDHTVYGKKPSRDLQYDLLYRASVGYNASLQAWFILSVVASTSCFLWPTCFYRRFVLVPTVAPLRGATVDSNAESQQKRAQNKTNLYTEMEIVEQIFRIFQTHGPYIVGYLRVDFECFGL